MRSIGHQHLGHTGELGGSNSARAMVAGDEDMDASPPHWVAAVTVWEVLLLSEALSCSAMTSAVMIFLTK
jgi:hypothetical protein